jgi:hypothetical protein
MDSHFLQYGRKYLLVFNFLVDDFLPDNELFSLCITLSIVTFDCNCSEIMRVQKNIYLYHPLASYYRMDIFSY